MKIQITITRLFPSGALECSTIYNGRLVSCRYFGFTMKQARAEFIADLQTRVTP